MTKSEVQAALQALGFYNGVIDGRFGDRSIAATKAFQAKVGLVVDGIAGSQTQTALKRAPQSAKPGRPEPDKSVMSAPVAPSLGGSTVAIAPPNVVSLKLLDTARPISEIIWHCTATAEGKDYTVADIRAWHKARGWSDIGYHYVVYRDGRIMLGRPVGQVGAHVEGRNTGTIGCSYVGGVTADGKTPKDTRTPAQRASMLWLTRELRRRHKGVRKVSGHREYSSKACPSFDVRKDALGAIA